MSWRERLLKASLDGVPFFVESAPKNGGRRKVEQKIAGRTEPIVQDLGGDVGRLTLNAYVIGPEYDLARDKLEAVLDNAEGSLTLIHPYRGVLSVTVVGEYETSESKDQGGFASIRFTVVKTPPTAKFTSQNKAQLVKDNAALAQLSTARRMEATFEASIYNTEKPTGRSLQKCTEAIRKVNTKINGKIGKIDATTSKIERFQKQLSDLIAAPEKVAAAIGSLINSVFSTVRTTEAEAVLVIEKLDSGALVRVMIDGGLQQAKLFGQDLQEVVTGSSSANQEAANQAAVISLTRIGFLAETANVISTLPFESFEQATDVRRKFVQTIDAIALDANDEEYEAIKNLSSAMASFLSEAAKSLPEIGSYTPSTVLPSVVIAHLLYGDASREAEIVDRNTIGHPGFVPEGEALEVLHA